MRNGNLRRTHGCNNNLQEKRILRAHSLTIYVIFHLHVHAMEYDHSTQVGLEHINHDNIIDTVRIGDYEISVQRPTK